MGAVVKYRDLPGGPTDVRLGEEISRHCLCTQCGMLSMSVFEDPQGHVFCSACIDEHSYKNHKYDIFCKYEQRNVLLNEMFDAKDVVTVIQDQWTFCPNKKCETAVPLKALNDHYARCMSLVQCSAGHRTVPTEEWKVHWKIHSSGSHEEPAAMEANKYQRPMESPSRNTAYQRNSQSPQPSHSQFYVPAQQNPVASPIAPTTTNARRSYGSSPQATQSSLFSTQPLRTASASSPGSLRLQITLAGGDATPKLLPCDHCGKPVKEDNMASHLDVCARVRQACVYCDTMLLKADIVAHFRQCGENPDNVSLSSQTTTDAVDIEATTSRPKTLAGHNSFEALAANSYQFGQMEPSGPVLPTLIVSHEQMECWFNAFEEHLCRHGITNYEEKYYHLKCALAKDVLEEVRKTIAREQEQKRPYEILKKALFKKRKKKTDGDLFSRFTQRLQSVYKKPRSKPC